MLRSPTRRWWRKRQIWWIWLIRFALERFIAFEHPCHNALDDSRVRGWEIERDYASMQYVTNWRRFRYHQFHRQVASLLPMERFFFLLLLLYNFYCHAPLLAVVFIGILVVEQRGVFANSAFRCTIFGMPLRCDDEMHRSTRSNMEQRGDWAPTYHESSSLKVRRKKN